MSIDVYGHKHLVQCSCIVPGLTVNVFYQFPVFSLYGVNENNENAFIEKYVNCPNCAALHHVTGYCKSTIVSRNDTITPITIDDIRISIPQDISMILDSYNADLATWEEVRHIVLSKLKNVAVILKIEINSNVVHGKRLMFDNMGNTILDGFSEQLYIE